MLGLISAIQTTSSLKPASASRKQELRLQHLCDRERSDYRKECSALFECSASPSHELVFKLAECSARTRGSALSDVSSTAGGPFARQPVHWALPLNS